MNSQVAQTNKNAERRIRKHIHGQSHTIECLVPAGFIELGKRAAAGLVKKKTDDGTIESTVIKSQHGRVRIEGIDFDGIHQFLIEGTVFTEIGLRIHRSRCSTEQKMLQILNEIEWDLWLPEPKKTKIDFRVDSHSSQLYHEARTKRLISEFFEKKKFNVDANSDNKNVCCISLDVIFERDVLEIFVSLSGRNFWKRGHKENIRHAAPLREDIASCLVHRLAELTTEHLQISQPTCVINPFCGTGTLLHESAIYLWKSGHLSSERSEWAYSKLPFFKDKSFAHALKLKAQSIALTPTENAFKVRFIGEDLDADLCRVTQAWFDQTNLKLSRQAHAKILNIDSCFAKISSTDFGGTDAIWVLANPPFGLRLSTERQGGIEELYSNFALRMSELFVHLNKISVSASCLILCPNEVVWKILQNTLKEFRRESEHFTLGGLDIRAFYAFNKNKR